MDEVQAGKIGREQLLEWTKTLERYRAGHQRGELVEAAQLRRGGQTGRHRARRIPVAVGLAAQRGDEQARGRDGGLSGAGGAAA